MNKPAKTAPAPAIDGLVLQFLVETEKKAAFVGDLVLASRKRRAGEALEVEAAIGKLEAAGRVLVRNHVCGDPHLDSADLRIAGLIDSSGNEDGRARAVAAIEETWSQWLAEFLSNHRCGE
jgi:hypothetical protein